MSAKSRQLSDGRSTLFVFGEPRRRSSSDSLGGEEHRPDRRPLHPGAQSSLFPSLEFRYWGHYTDAAGAPVALDCHMRAHAHVEDHIRRLKSSGLERFPFCDLDANRAWMAVVCFGADLVRWFQLLCFTGALAVAEPKALRWTLWHTPARIVRRGRRQIVRILDGLPTAEQLLGAYGRINLIT